MNNHEKLWEELNSEDELVIQKNNKTIDLYNYRFLDFDS